MNFGKDHIDFRFPVTPKEQIEKCLNCKLPDCNGVCYSRSMRKHTYIRCVETGGVFKTQRDAAKFAGRSRSQICKHLMGDCPSCGGYHFERVEAWHV